MLKKCRFSRRKFVVGCSACVLSVAGTAGAFWPFSATGEAERSQSDIRGSIFRDDAPDKLWKWNIEASHYSKLEGSRVRCSLCPNRCVLAPGDRSICRSRVNMEGRLYSLVYGNPCAVYVDPVEKTPVSFHARDESILHRYNRLQFQMPQLSELGDFPGQPP